MILSVVKELNEVSIEKMFFGYFGGCSNYNENWVNENILVIDGFEWYGEKIRVEKMKIYFFKILFMKGEKEVRN